MLNVLIIYHHNISCNAILGSKMMQRTFVWSFLYNSVLFGTSFGNVKGYNWVINTLLNMLNSYYIVTLLDVTIVNVNLVENIIFYVAIKTNTLLEDFLGVHPDLTTTRGGHSFLANIKTNNMCIFNILKCLNKYLKKLWV